MRSKPLFKLVMSAVFVAIGLLLPLITGQLPQVNRVILPMHIPIFLCGLLCGPWYGSLVGVVTPLMRSGIFGVPVLYPTAMAMAFELAVYGGISGAVYGIFKKQNTVAVYCALLPAMIMGRVIRGIAECILLNLGGKEFLFSAYFTTTVLSSLVGAAVQLVLIPLLMLRIKPKNKIG